MPRFPRNDQQDQKERDEQASIRKSVKESREIINTFLLKPIADDDVDTHINSVGGRFRKEDITVGIDYRGYMNVEFYFNDLQIGSVSPYHSSNWWAVNREDLVFPFTSSVGWTISVDKSRVIIKQAEEKGGIEFSFPKCSPISNEVILNNTLLAEVEWSFRELSELLPHRHTVQEAKQIHNRVLEDSTQRLDELVNYVGRLTKKFSVGERVKIKHHYSGAFMGIGKIISLRHREFLPMVLGPDTPYVRTIYSIEETPAKPLREGETPFIFEDIDESALVLLET